jgi:hypothetical protein
MSMTLEIKTADELLDPEPDARWAVRRTAREGEILHRIFRGLLTGGQGWRTGT